MHPRNKHQDRYDLDSLGSVNPKLIPFVKDDTIDFSNQEAVRELNRAILLKFYDLSFWDIPQEFLCPPIPGRADYIHSVSDLFEEKRNLRVLDVGTGANCIYPLLGVREYGWTFVGSDVNKNALKNAELIVEKNNLSAKIKLRHQRDKTKIFTFVIKADERFDLSICNPPFHESLEEANKGTERKWKNLGRSELKGSLNFGGQGAELWCPGGEKSFILKMIEESLAFKNQVRWFSTLVSKASNLSFLVKKLEKSGITFKVIEMSQGQKQSRLLCWTFQT